MKKMAILFRKIHRYLTIPFIVITLSVKFFTQGTSINESLYQLQRMSMLIFALTGLYMFVYPYLRKKIKSARK